MLTVPIYETSGERSGEETIDPADFGDTINKQLLHEVVLMHLANRRVGTVNTRGRADVAGSSRKMYRQKGTGHARVGPKRTNKRVGGGAAFARRNRDYSYRLPKKAVRKAIRMAILSKFQDNQALVIRGLDLGPQPKTKAFVQILRSIPRPDLDPSEAEPVEGETRREALDRTLDGRTLLLATADHDPLLYRGARNVPGVQVRPVAELNTYEVLRHRYLVFTPESLTALKERVREPIRRRPEPAASTAASSTR